MRLLFPCAIGRLYGKYFETNLAPGAGKPANVLAIQFDPGADSFPMSTPQSHRRTAPFSPTKTLLSIIDTMDCEAWWVNHPENCFQCSSLSRRQFLTISRRLSQVLDFIRSLPAAPSTTARQASWPNANLDSPSGATRDEVKQTYEKLTAGDHQAPRELPADSSASLSLQTGAQLRKGNELTAQQPSPPLPPTPQGLVAGGLIVSAN